ncbi:hypothetical protein BC828DRAFT_383641 [Blastocladiella britannica]|nr:hypothetical protein BC828DRAFT_383641 [Blastocladiella britannica]
MNRRGQRLGDHRKANRQAHQPPEARQDHQGRAQDPHRDPPSDQGCYHHQGEAGLQGQAPPQARQGHCQGLWGRVVVRR